MEDEGDASSGPSISDEKAAADILRKFFATETADDLKKVVDPVISRNAFMAHPENLLLSMLADERWHIRELALRRIMKTRESSSVVERRPQTKLKSQSFHRHD
ncbi:hypothetical protein AVEN_78988-1 [Araneus ventricosus]|uniref:Uncharacterized protein n=1 Tax=Araneus ventricosus TaxID=182803 RepID=A0A4Y2WA96_ARAVE|nr:hypothetical protein AVEN_78988-1 [Araneus ventricosus]